MGAGACVEVRIWVRGLISIRRARELIFESGAEGLVSGVFPRKEENGNYQSERKENDSRGNGILWAEIDAGGESGGVSVDGERAGELWGNGGARLGSGGEGAGGAGFLSAVGGL